jgi:hypothetical protein
MRKKDGQLCCQHTAGQGNEDSGLTTATPDGKGKTGRWGGDARAEDVSSMHLRLGLAPVSHPCQ